MPLQLVNYAGLTPHNGPSTSDFLDMYQKGIKTAYMPQNEQVDLKQKQLAAALAQINLQYAPQMTQAELAYKQAQTPNLNANTNYTNQQAQYYGPNVLSEISARNALTKLNEAKGRLPFGGATLPGVGGQIIALESIKQMYGEGSPQYQTAKKKFDLDQQNIASRINYQNSLSSSMPLRYLTPTGKGTIEEANVRQGNAPTGATWEQQINPNQDQQNLPAVPQQLPLSAHDIKTLQAVYNQQQPNSNQSMIQPAGDQRAPQGPQSANQAQLAQALQAAQAAQLQQGQQQPQQVSPQQQAVAQQLAMQQAPAQSPLAPASPEELGNQYELKKQKDTTDSATRAKNLYATNIEKTLGTIDVDKLVKYSGLKGGLSFLQEKAQDAAGLPVSESYKQYKEALDSSEFLASQARQFYGESIQPSMREKLELLTNPSSWLTSPDTAKRIFKQTEKILGMEMKTYRDALKDKGVYLGTENNRAPAAQSAQRGYSQADLEHTAKLRGITVEEVKRKLGIR